MTSVTNIHNVESVKIDGIRRSEGSRGWFTLKIETVSQFTGPTGEVEITLFTNDIEAIRSSIIEQLTQEIPTYA